MTNPDESIPNEVPEIQRNEYHQRDVMNTAMVGRWEEGNAAAEVDVEDCVRAAEDLLDCIEDDSKVGRLPSKEDVDAVLKKLDAAIAISNEPYARKLRKGLLMRFGH